MTKLCLLKNPHDFCFFNLLISYQAIWHRRKGIQGLNTQGRGRQLDTCETHWGGEIITHLRGKTWQDMSNRTEQNFKIRWDTAKDPNIQTLDNNGP